MRLLRQRPDTLVRGPAREADSVRFQIPDGGRLWVHDVAGGPDGSFWVAGNTINGVWRKGTFLASISADGSRQSITRVWPFAPAAVTVGPDGTVWAVGPTLTEDYRLATPNVLRHYSASGELLASTDVPRLRRTPGGVYEVGEISWLVTSNDRIGWLTAACEYVEFSFNLTELGRYPCPNGERSVFHVGGMALSSTNDLLVGGRTDAVFAPLELDRSVNAWKPVLVHNGTDRPETLLGFDGPALVTYSNHSALHRYAWPELH